MAADTLWAWQRSMRTAPPLHWASRRQSEGLVKLFVRDPRLVGRALLAAAALVIVLAAAIGFAVTRGPAGHPPPPAGGYFELVPPGRFQTLPTDAQAAAAVNHSAWEPRPENATANHTTAPVVHSLGYSGMINHAAVFGRITGDFTGTTDEIIQWAAVKWGLPDDLVRAEAAMESSWYQGEKDSRGVPLAMRGYGDFGSCGGSPAPSGYGPGGPASFGLLQVKWCSMKDPGAAGYDGWPWTERSTAYNLDVYGAVMRGCLEGWDVWLGARYAAGDLWGCVGRWFSGQWHSSAAEGYSAHVRDLEVSRPWRDWADHADPTSQPSRASVGIVIACPLRVDGCPPGSLRTRAPQGFSRPLKYRAMASAQARRITSTPCSLG